MKAYKVVYNNGSKLLSSVVGELEYEIYHKTIPEKDCGPLCAFKYLKDAQAFAVCGEMIYKCDAQISKETKVWTHNCIVSQTNLPNGTILCDSIILLKEIKHK